MIPPGHKANFATMQRAFAAGEVALMECTDAATGKPVMVVCAAVRTSDGGAEFTPMAKMFDGNPYEELNPP